MRKSKYTSSERLAISYLRRVFLWSKERKAAKKPNCEKCGIITLKPEVDHILALRNTNYYDLVKDVVKKMLEGPFQSLCKACHKQKTADDRKGGTI